MGLDLDLDLGWVNGSMENGLKEKKIKGTSINLNNIN